MSWLCCFWQTCIFVLIWLFKSGLKNIFIRSTKTKIILLNFCLNLCFRLWDIECGACLRILEGHEELVRCIRFDSKRIVSGAYDGWVKFLMFYPTFIVYILIFMIYIRERILGSSNCRSFFNKQEFKWWYFFKDV